MNFEEMEVVSTQKVFCKKGDCDVVIVIYKDGDYDVICPVKCSKCDWTAK
jgi:hypothetical protein